MNLHRPVPRRGVAVRRLLVVLAVILLVVGPILFREIPREVARWRLASAQDAVLNRDYQLALTQLDRAIAWDDSAAELFLQRAYVKGELRQWESGLQDCDRAASLSADGGAVGQQRSDLLMHLHRYGEAIGQMKELLRSQVPESETIHANWLNMLAYLSALGDRELDQALASVNQALDLTGTQAGMLDPVGYLAFHRAYSAHHRGEQELAVASLKLAERAPRRPTRRRCPEPERWPTCRRGPRIMPSALPSCAHIWPASWTCWSPTVRTRNPSRRPAIASIWSSCSPTETSPRPSRWATPMRSRSWA